MPNVTDHTLRRGNYRCHGGPLPHQLANSTRAALCANQKILSCMSSDNMQRIRYYLLFLGAVPVTEVRHPRVTHQSAALGCSKLQLTARLACLRRAASVRSEPGSNSP